MADMRWLARHLAPLDTKSSPVLLRQAATEAVMLPPVLFLASIMDAATTSRLGMIVCPLVDSALMYPAADVAPPVLYSARLVTCAEFSRFNYFRSGQCLVQVELHVRLIRSSRNYHGPRHRATKALS